MAVAPNADRRMRKLVAVLLGLVLAAAAMAPDYWTVFNAEKAAEAGAAADRIGRRQDLLARVQTEGDIFYRGHEGGFAAQDIVKVADELDGPYPAPIA